MNAVTYMDEQEWNEYKARTAPITWADVNWTPIRSGETVEVKILKPATDKTQLEKYPDEMNVPITSQEWRARLDEILSATPKNILIKELFKPIENRELMMKAWKPTLAPRRCLRTKEAAAYLAVSARQIRKLAQDGKLPILQEEPGAPWRFDVKDLDAYIDQNKRIVE